MPRDKYPSLPALQKALGEDSYFVRCLNRHSRYSILSCHGGYIEAGTSSIARAVAGRRWNLFDFQGLRPELATDMHVTSTRFRHPVLINLLRSSEIAVSIHGMGDQGHQTIWLGGLNRNLKELTLTALRAWGFSVDPDSPLYRGENPRNVVNLAPARGVQLEIPNELMSTIFSGKAFLGRGKRPTPTPRFDAIVKAVRFAVQSYTRLPPTKHYEVPEEYFLDAVDTPNLVPVD